jgi:hypothetical protein
MTTDFNFDGMRKKTTPPSDTDPTNATNSVLPIETVSVKPLERLKINIAPLDDEVTPVQAQEEKLIDEVTPAVSVAENELDNFNPLLDEDGDDDYTPGGTVEQKPPVVQSNPVARIETKSDSDVSKSYKRSRLTATDRELIEFLYDFGYASVSQLRALFEGKRYVIDEASGGQKKKWQKTGKPLTADPILKRLKGLEAIGLVERQALAFGNILWFCTDLGQKLIGRSSGPEPKRVRNLALSGTPHTLMRNQVAASLIGFQKFGAESLNVLGVRSLTGVDFEFVTSTFIERSWNSTYKKVPAPIDKAKAQEEMKSRALTEALSGQLTLDGLEDRYPSLWTPVRVWQDTDKARKPKVYPDGNPVLKSLSATPDMVLRMPRKTINRGESIALEFERENKSIPDYYYRFLAYKNWQHIYRAVYYVILEKNPSRKGARNHTGEDQKSKILRAIKLADCEGFIKVVPLKNTDGEIWFNDKSIWQL